MMRKFVSLIAAMVVLSLIVLAQDKKPVTLTGVLMDKACSARHLKAANPQEAAANDPKDCALKEGCLKSGLGIFSDGKYTVFDEKGTALAKASLEKTAKAKGATFKVTGTVAEGTMTVKEIAEVK